MYSVVNVGHLRYSSKLSAKMSPIFLDVERNLMKIMPLLLVTLTLIALPARAANAGAFPAPSSLVNWWPADGNAKDIMGGNNGTLINGASFSPGEVRQSFSLNGIGQYVQAASAIPFRSNDFSIDLWARLNSVIPSTLSNPSDIFIGDDNGGGENDKWFFALGGGALYFHINSPTISCRAGTNGPCFFAQYPFTPNLNQWYNLAVTRSSGTITIYVNGAQVSSDFTLDTSNPTAPMTIGWAEGLSFVDGLIDEVQIYNGALAASDIQSIFDADSNGIALHTSTIVSCSPNTIEDHHSTTCIASVTNPSRFATPTGIVSWSSNGVGTFSTTSCTLSGTGSTSTCTVIYTATPGKPTLQTITGSYSGDTYHFESSGSMAITVH